MTIKPVLLYRAECYATKKKKKKKKKEVTLQWDAYVMMDEWRNKNGQKK